MKIFGKKLKEISSRAEKRRGASLRGFTLIETLVAITIFAFSITALISITATGVFDTNFVKNKFTAGYLALEGAELVRNIRDSAATTGYGWSSLLSEPTLLERCYGGSICYIDSDPDEIIPVATECPPTGCPPLYYRQSDASFNYNGPDFDNPETIFNREISIESVVPNEVRVTSTVKWQQGSEMHSVKYDFELSSWANPIN